MEQREGGGKKRKVVPTLIPDIDATRQTQFLGIAISITNSDLYSSLINALASVWAITPQRLEF
jgi:hypothetical protein